MPPAQRRCKAAAALPLRGAGRYRNIRRRLCHPPFRSLNMSRLRGSKPAPFLLQSAAALLMVALAAAAISDQTRPNETPAQFSPRVGSFDYTQREVMIPMRDGVKLQTVILIPRGGAARADPTHSHAVRRHRAHHQARQRAPRGADRQHRCGRGRRFERRLYPRRAGRARQTRFGRRLRDDPAAARAAESDRRRSFHRYLRHHRLARQEHSRDQRQGRHSRHLVRRLYLADGAGSPASGAARGGSDQRDGRRLDGR